MNVNFFPVCVAKLLSLVSVEATKLEVWEALEFKRRVSHVHGGFVSAAGVTGHYVHLL